MRVQENKKCFEIKQSKLNKKIMPKKSYDSDNKKITRIPSVAL